MLLRNVLKLECLEAYKKELIIYALPLMGAFNLEAPVVLKFVDQDPPAGYEEFGMIAHCWEFMKRHKDVSLLVQMTNEVR